MKNFRLGAIAILSGTALLLTSCYVPYGGYYSSGGYATGGDTMVDWVDASYDVNGYPIYGYSYGRPVYGYTDAGVAIFTIAALSALCFIPNWGPASWYHGHYHRPAGRPYASPPRYAAGHHPQNRPKGGMNADVHRNPNKYTHKGGASSPNSRPGGSSSHNSRPGGSSSHSSKPGSPSSHSSRPSGSSSHSHVTSSHKSTASRVQSTARSTGSRTHSTARSSMSRVSSHSSHASHSVGGGGRHH